MIIRTLQDRSSTKRMIGLSSYQDLLNKRCLTNSLTCLPLMFSIRLLFRHLSFQTMKNLVFLRMQGSSWNRDRLLMRLGQMGQRMSSLMVSMSKSSMQEVNLTQQDHQKVSWIPKISSLATPWKPSWPLVCLKWALASTFTNSVAPTTNTARRCERLKKTLSRQTTSCATNGVKRWTNSWATLSKRETRPKPSTPVSRSWSNSTKTSQCFKRQWTW